MLSVYNLPNNSYYIVLRGGIRCWLPFKLKFWFTILFTFEAGRGESQRLKKAIFKELKLKIAIFGKLLRIICCIVYFNKGKIKLHVFFSCFFFSKRAYCTHEINRKCRRRPTKRSNWIDVSIWRRQFFSVIVLIVGLF